MRAADLASAAWHRAPSFITAVRARVLRRRAVSRFARERLPYRLCLGSGRAPIEGWTNVDYYFPADVTLDLRSGLPISDNSADLIYSEHLVEHLTLEDALALFAECHRVLRRGGTMRIATPDLADIVRDYVSDWRRHDWVNREEYRWVDSGTRMVNTAVRHWGHVYLWDFPELARRLREAGFTDVRRFEVGESHTEALRNLETRADSRLIVEAIAAELPQA